MVSVPVSVHVKQMPQAYNYEKLINNAQKADEFKMWSDTATFKWGGFRLCLWFVQRLRHTFDNAIM